MANEITVPRLGWSMEEGLFAGWLKAEGDPVIIGEPIYALESDKVTMEVEALDSGFLHIPANAPTPGSSVVVGQLLGYLLAEGEAPPTATPASPRARAAAKNLGIDISTVQPREGAARIIEADVLKVKPAAPLTTISNRMEESFRASHFYIHADANVEKLASIHDQHGPAAYDDFLLKAIAIARPEAGATLLNLGSFGIDRFEAILNPPQSMIVAVGKIAKRPVVEGDQVVARLTMPISLSVDHRVVDVIPAAAFLQTLIGILEAPEATYNEWE